MAADGVNQGFIFINVSHPNDVRQRTIQRAIRSGSMAAVGLARRKRHPKKSTANQPKKQHVLCKWKELGPGTIYPTLLYPGVAPALPFLGMFAVDPNRRARELLNFIHLEADYVYRPFWRGWMVMAMLEPSTYYLCLANAALYMNHSLHYQTSLEYTDCVESTNYYSMCLRLALNLLKDPAERTSPGLISTILGFVCHNLTVGKWDQSEMHLQGLDRIICNRKGFHGLGDHVPLFAAWFDVINSAIHDKVPRFSIPTTSYDNILLSDELSLPLVGLFSRLQETDVNLPDLGACLSHVAQLTIYVNKNAQLPNFWKEGLKATSLIGPAARRVLSLSRLDTSNHTKGQGHCPKRLLQEIVRLALLMLLANLKDAFSLISAESRSLHEKFSNLLPLMTSLVLFPELRLWALLVHACTQRSPMTPAQCSEIHRAMTDPKIPHGEGAIQAAKSVIWVDSLMDSELDRLKHEINQYSGF